jgi:threonine aldolase
MDRLRLNFASDNVVGACPAVMEALTRANEGPAAAYGADPWTTAAEAALATLFERPVAVALVATGTAANALALSCLVDPWGAVLTHEESHIADDEVGAPEFFCHGAKLIGLPGAGAKLTPEVVAAQLARMPAGPIRQTPPQALSITQATECGTVYTPDEIAALSAVAKGRGLTLHMDGARFANAVAALACAPADITWRVGVDVLSFGLTKNGAWAAEAVVFFDAERARTMPWRRKRGGHTLSKGRFLGAQVAALLADGHWLTLARQANAAARRLARGLTAEGGVRLAWPCAANEVFPILSDTMAAHLRAAGVVFHPWSARSLPAGQPLGPSESVYRFVCAFDAQEEAVDHVIALVAAARAGREARRP